jgi:peptide/nickel transport system permease protein
MATVLGTALGLVTGYFRGGVDDVLSRMIEALLALPVIIMGLLIAVALGPTHTTLNITIGLLFAPIISRTVRAAVLTERELEYVAAARLRNERTPYVLFGEILPNVTAPIVVEFTVRLGYSIFVAAGLSFLGFGIQPPAPDWGVQVAEHYGVISGGFWWPVLFPSLAIATLVIGVNLIADGVASAFER